MASRLAVVTAVVGLFLAALPGSAAARTGHVTWMKGYDAPGTPKRLDRVGVLKIGPRKARNVLVFNPGSLAGSARIAPFAHTLVKKAKGWQVWSVERRENQLEDQSVADKAKAGKATSQELFDYYLGWLIRPSITHHFQPIPDSKVEYAKKWGMKVAIHDLRKVVKRASRRGGHVVLAGSSLGGWITTAYATWDFGGRPGARGLSGLVYDDSGSSPTPVRTDQARQSLASLNQPTSSPWLAFEGIPTPFAGVFPEVGGILSLIDPNGPSLAQSSGLLPASLVPPMPATNLANFGYAFDTETSPAESIEAHVGHLAASGNPRGWVQGNDITPIKRYANMSAGWGLKDADGTAWYQPKRLNIDIDAIAAGNRNPAQRVLGLRTTKGHRLPRGLRIYAFGALYGKQILDEARTLARQSGIPKRQLTLVNRHGVYAHNDAAGAFPRNAFMAHLVPFLKRIARKR